MIELFQQSVEIALLILIIIGIRKMFLKMLPYKTFLFLWGIVVVRLLIPIDIPSQFNIFTIISSIDANSISSDNEPKIENNSTIIDPLEMGQPNLFHIDTHNQGIDTLLEKQIQKNGVENHEQIQYNWDLIVNIVRMSGACFMFLFIIINHMKHSKIYKAAIPISNDNFIRLQNQFGFSRDIKIKESDRVLTPLTYGILMPIIILPKDFLRIKEEQIKYVFAHELTHIKNFDVIKKWVLVITLCIYWFNPFVWIMYLLANRDIEICCDESVIQYFGRDKKASYALTLLLFEEKKNDCYYLSSYFCKLSTQERILSIMKGKKTTIVTLSIAFVLVIVVGLIFATSVQNKEEMIKIESKGNEEQKGIVKEEYTTYMESSTVMKGSIQEELVTYTAGNQNETQLSENQEFILYIKDAGEIKSMIDVSIDNKVKRAKINSTNRRYIGDEELLKYENITIIEEMPSATIRYVDNEGSEISVAEKQQDYITIHISLLIDLINRVGGIMLDVDSGELPHLNGYLYTLSSEEKIQYKEVKEEGIQILNGIQAIAYSYIDYTGDNEEERKNDIKKREGELIDGLIEGIIQLDEGKQREIENLMFSQSTITFTAEELKEIFKKILSYEIQIQY